MTYTFTRKELTDKSGKEFSEGDIILVGRYRIRIRYGKYNSPIYESRVEDARTHKPIDVWPVGGRGAWPLYIEKFLRK